MLKLIITTISKNHIITFLMASWQLIDNQRGPQIDHFHLSLLVLRLN